MSNVFARKIATRAHVRLDDTIRLAREPESEGVTDADCLQALKKIGDVDELRLEINSDGGACIAMQNIIDALTLHPAKKLVTVNCGKAYSAAGIIFCCGHERIMHPDSWWMTHPAASGPERIRTKSSRQWDEKIRDFIAKRTGIDRALIAGWDEKETYFDAQQCLAFGIATKIEGEPLPKVTRPEVPAAVQQKRDFAAMERDRELRSALRFEMQRQRILHPAKPKALSRQGERSRLQPIPLPHIPAHLRGKVFFSSADCATVNNVAEAVDFPAGPRAAFDAANRRMLLEGRQRQMQGLR